MAPIASSSDRPAASVPPVFLHIGAMKSGTTYLQKVLRDHKDDLAASGYLFPGATWKAQIRAAQDVTGAIPDDPVIHDEASGAWEALAQEMLAHRGKASIVSMEFLTHAAPDQVRAAIESLAPAEVHVILTLRDATRTIPSQWQTSVRSKSAVGWEDFQVGVRKAGGIRARMGRRFSEPTARKFRRIHDVPRILEAWGHGVPPERLSVITVPTSKTDPTALWRRFAGVVGLDPELGSASPPANESLGYASTELVRRLNIALDDVPLHDHYAIVREQLAKRILAPRSNQERRALLDQATFDFGLAWNARTHESVQRSGARVVGDLEEDLPTREVERHQGAVDDEQQPPTPDELLAAAETAVDGLTSLLERQRRRADKRGAPGDVGKAARGRRAPAAPSSTDPVAAAVAEIADLCRAAIELRRHIKG